MPLQNCWRQTQGQLIRNGDLNAGQECQKIPRRWDDVVVKCMCMWISHSVKYTTYVLKTCQIHTQQQPNYGDTDPRQKRYSVHYIDDVTYTIRSIFVRITLYNTKQIRMWDKRPASTNANVFYYYSTLVVKVANKTREIAYEWNNNEGTIMHVRTPNSSLADGCEHKYKDWPATTTTEIKTHTRQIVQAEPFIILTLCLPQLE